LGKGEVMGYQTNDDLAMGGNEMNRTEVDFAVKEAKTDTCSMCNAYEAKQYMKEEANGELRGLMYMVPTCSQG